MSKKKGIVEKERVVCQNCRYHYSYLYDAREPMSVNLNNLTGTLSNYRNQRESFRACPHCGFYQSWMVAARRKHRLLDFFLLTLFGGCGVLAYLLYQMARVVIDPIGVGGFEPVNLAQNVLAGYIGVAFAAGLLYAIYLRLAWNPNRQVDTESYEATTPREICPEDLINSISQYEAATRRTLGIESAEEKELAGSSWSVLSFSKKIFLLLGFLIGIVSVAGLLSIY